MQVKIHEGQYEVANDPHKYRVINAGRQWGKSVLARLIVLEWAIKNPGIYWIVSPTYRQGKQNHWNDIQKEIPRDWVAKKNEVDLSVTLKNGSVIELKGAENPDSLRGATLKGLCVDEIASIRNWDWLWSEVLSATLVRYDSPVIFISTPKGYNAFYDLYQRGLGDDPNWKSWHFTSYQNKYLKKEVIDEKKAELTEDTFAQEYLADFRKYTGLVYKEFQREVHIIEQMDIPPEWTIYRGIDFGSTNPTSCLWVAVDNDENWYVVGEHYQTGETIDYHSGLINANPLSKRVSASYGDPSGAQWISEFAQRGIYITPANKETGTNFNSWVRFGIEKVSEKLKTTPGHIVSSLPQTGGDKPRESQLYVFATCVNTIREFETYRWKEKSVTQAQDLNEPDVPEKANDHCFVGNTMILTKNGWQQIRNINKGDYVWSPFGWNEVYRAGSTGVKRVKDYGLFESTPDHKVLTSRGLVEVDKLRYSDTIMTCTKPSSFKESLIDAIRMPKAELIGFIFNALLTKSLMARRDFYIETYGNSIKVRFLMAIWFIILTVTLSITTLAILSLSLLLNMLNVITGVSGMVWKSILTVSGIRLKNGMLQKKVSIGTANTARRLGLGGSLLLKPVAYAINHFKRILEGQNIAAEFVRPRHSEEEEVFNLATKFGCYFANGVLVSNSMDALRYFAVSYKKQTEDFDNINEGLKDKWRI